MSEPNRNTGAARHFHNITKYVQLWNGDEPGAILMGEPPNLGPALGEQEPALEPLPYKIYTTLDPLPLPKEPFTTSLRALEALTADATLPTGQAIPDRTALAHFFLRGNGTLKQWRGPNGREYTFRGAGCTGARYHLELYLVCGNLPDLAAGVYQYAAHDHSLRRLRAGDYRAAVVEATGNEPSVAQAPAVVILTSTFWRNAWRYQERSYRHALWDVGTIYANLLAVAASAGLPTKVIMGFADRQINALVDVDGEREAALSLLVLGRNGGAPEPVPAVEPLGYPTQQISVREIPFPEIQAMHHASSLDSGSDVSAWRADLLRRTPPPPTGPMTPLQPLAPSDLPDESIDAVIQRRRSNRHYATEEPLSFAAFSTVLERSIAGTAMDCLDPAASPLFDPYLIVNNVEGLAPGTYVFHRDRSAVELLKPGGMRAEAARLCCGQNYAANAQVVFFTLTDLTPALASYGNRAYRVAQVEAALFGSRMQLAAHALKLGAVGSTCPDDEVTAFFSPHAAGKSFMFVGVFGRKRPPSTDESSSSTRFLRGDRGAPPPAENDD